jgi:hypothetical protein
MSSNARTAPVDERLAPAVCELGLLLVGDGRLAEAEALLRRGLAIDDAGARRVDRRARPGLHARHPGALATSKGDPSEAEALLRRALALATLDPVLGPADVGATLSGLAKVLIDPRPDTRGRRPRAPRASPCTSASRANGTPS